jgi:hypothetical protein
VHPINRNLVMLAALLAITMLAGGWFVFLRGGGPPGEFLTAYDHFVSAAHQVQAAEAKVERYLELPEFKSTVDAAIVVMKRESAVFQRLARSEEGTAATIAAAAYAATAQALTAVDSYADDIIRTQRIAEAESALASLRAALATLDGQASEWKKLS